MPLPDISTVAATRSPAQVAPVDLSQTFAVGQDLLGTVIRMVPQGGALVNFNGQYVLLDFCPALVPGQSLAATVMQVSPTLMLQLTDEPTSSLLASATPPLAQTLSEMPQGVFTAAELKAYLTAVQPFGQTVTMLADLLNSHPALRDMAPELTQALRDTLAVLQPQGEVYPDAAQLQEQVTRSGINYESKVQRALTGVSLGNVAELAKDLKGQLLALSQRLTQVGHMGADAWHREAATVLAQVERAVHALELQQLSNQFAFQEHQPLLLSLLHPLHFSAQTTQLAIRREDRQAGHLATEPERYTVTLWLDLTALGPLHIEATVQGTEVYATVQGEDAGVVDCLRAALPDLVARLQALGLHVCVACDLRAHAAHDDATPLPHALTRAVQLVDVTV